MLREITTSTAIGYFKFVTAQITFILQKEIILKHHVHVFRNITYL